MLGTNWGDSSLLMRAVLCQCCSNILPLSLCCLKDKEKSVTEQRRFSLIDPSSESEVIRLQHRLVSTEDVLRNALEQGHQMEKLMEAMRLSSEKTQVPHQPAALISPLGSCQGDAIILADKAQCYKIPASWQSQSLCAPENGC